MDFYRSSSNAARLCAFALSALTVTGVGAVNVTQAVEAAAARRAAAGAGSKAAAAAERAAWQRLAREADDTAVRNIQRQFGRYLPDSAKGLPAAKVLTREEFDLHLQRHFPDMSTERRKALLGYQKDGTVVVNMNQQELLLTVAHERLHQFAHPRFHQTFGRDLNEGMTERFAKMTTSDLHLMDLPPVYAAQVRLADTLGARVGIDRLSRAYFKGEIEQLKAFMDADLGRGTFAKFVDATNRSDLELAWKVLAGR